MSSEDRFGMCVMLTCRDVKASAAFYAKLGFEMKESWPTPEDPMWANLVLAGQSVMIGAAMDPAEVGNMCEGDAATEKYWKASSEAFRDHPSGVGIQVYLQVDDVDAYHVEVKKNGIAPETEPKTQFYGIRDFAVNDLDGYRLVFHTPVAMESCQSCGMPIADGAPGQMYCQYCTNEKGELKPYEAVFEGTVQGYFMGMQKMERPAAEEAAKEHLSKMPAWIAR